MNLHPYPKLVLPVVCLAGGAFLLAPTRPAEAFALNGSFLSENQRDVRLFNNFADGTANANVTPAPQFPGELEAELAIWKGVVEWGSGLHGNGGGDPIGGNSLGSGGANFDAFWSGNATSAGTTDNNIVSVI